MVMDEQHKQFVLCFLCHFCLLIPCTQNIPCSNVDFVTFAMCGRQLQAQLIPIPDFFIVLCFQKAAVTSSPSRVSGLHGLLALIEMRCRGLLIMTLHVEVSAGCLFGWVGCVLAASPSLHWHLSHTEQYFGNWVQDAGPASSRSKPWEMRASSRLQKQGGKQSV